MGQAVSQAPDSKLPFFASYSLDGRDYAKILRFEPDLYLEIGHFGSMGLLSLVFGVRA